MRLFEAGDNKGASIILNLDETLRDAEETATRLNAIAEILEETQKAIESNIEEYRLQIKTLQSNKPKGWIDDVIALYDKAISIARGRISPERFAELLQKYVDFCQKNQVQIKQK